MTISSLKSTCPGIWGLCAVSSGDALGWTIRRINRTVRFYEDVRSLRQSGSLKRAGEDVCMLFDVWFNQAWRLETRSD